jgi:hypothetical protein
MLLRKRLAMIPCLDHGSVELLSCAPNGVQLKTIVNSMRRGQVGPQLLRMPMVYFKITAPYFVILALGNLKRVTDDSYKPEVYLPKLDDIGSPSLDTNQEIADSIQATIEAGHINRDMYVKDGCNQYVAKMTSTISTYWSGIVYGDLETWVNFYSQKHAPSQVKAYQLAVQDLLRVEYTDLDDYLRRSR